MSRSDFCQIESMTGSSGAHAIDCSILGLRGRCSTNQECCRPMKRAGWLTWSVSILTTLQIGLESREVIAMTPKALQQQGDLLSALHGIDSWDSLRDISIDWS